VTGDDEEQQREAQLQDEAQQREAKQLEEEQQREELRAAARGAGRGAGAATAAATTNQAAAGGCERPIPKQAEAAAEAGVPDGPSPFKTTSASATDTGREAAQAGLVANSTDTTTADRTAVAAAGVRGRPSPLEPPSAKPKHNPVRGAGATTAAATTNEAAAGGYGGPVPKKAVAAADAGALAEALTRKQAAVAADAGALAEASTRKQAAVAARPGRVRLIHPPPPQPMRGARPRRRA
jgi:hypothetical protein